VTGLDLSAVEKAILSWAIDDLRIDRDNGVADDALDPETLLLIASEGERVWAGKGAIQALTTFLDQGDPDVARVVDATGARFRALLPLRETIPARVGDVLTCDAVHSPSADPRLAGESFLIVHEGDPASFAVARIVYLRPVDDPAPPAPDPGP
jgi:hypothetical protein